VEAGPAGPQLARPDNDARRSETPREAEDRARISFAEIVFPVEHGAILDIIEHPNQERYGGQRVIVVQIDDYVYLVPCVEEVEEEEYVVSKLSFRAVKATRKYIYGKGESGEWRSVGSLAKNRKALWKLCSRHVSQGLPFEHSYFEQGP
jgi:hypothetical protein